MFALLALICFVLDLFDVVLGSIEFTTLGLVFVAAHLLVMGWGNWTPWRRTQ
jgi:hypothetical protein